MFQFLQYIANEHWNTKNGEQLLVSFTGIHLYYRQVLWSAFQCFSSKASLSLLAQRLKNTFLKPTLVVDLGSLKHSGIEKFVLIFWQSFCLSIKSSLLILAEFLLTNAFVLQVVKTTSRYEGQRKNAWFQDVFQPDIYPPDIFQPDIYQPDFFQPRLLPTSDTCQLRHFPTKTFTNPDFCQLKTLPHQDICQPRTFSHQDISLPRHFPTRTFAHFRHFPTRTFANFRHFPTKTFSNSDFYQPQTFSNQDFYQPRRFPTSDTFQPGLLPTKTFTN